MATHDAGGSVRRAIESIQNQTFRDFELIVVDAGSTDSTIRLLDSLAERDLRIQVVHADACSRQEALDLALGRACGRYLAVVDADGCARPGMLAELAGVAEARSLELAIGGMDLLLSSSSGRVDELELSAEAVVFLTQHDFRASAWRLFATGGLLPASAKLFRLDRVRELGLSFVSSGSFDHLFVLDYLSDVERVGVLDGVCYRVERRIAPIERRFARPEGYRLMEEEHAALTSLYRHWGLEGDAASMEMLQSRYLERLVACVEGVCGSASGISSAEQRKTVSSMIAAPQAQLAASVAHPESNAARSMLAPIKGRNVTLVCAQARLLSRFRRGHAVWAMPDAFV